MYFNDCGLSLDFCKKSRTSSSREASHSNSKSVLTSVSAILREKSTLFFYPSFQTFQINKWWDWCLQ